MSQVHHFFINAPATTEIYTLSLHDALPISTTKMARLPGSPPATWALADPASARTASPEAWSCAPSTRCLPRVRAAISRSEEHTSELQSPCNLVCRLLLEKKKKN